MDLIAVRRSGRLVRAIGLILLVEWLGVSNALAYSARVEDACRDDYLRLCSGYAVGSPALRSCMEAKVRSVSPRCVTALRKEGLIDPRRLKR